MSLFCLYVRLSFPKEFVKKRWCTSPERGESKNMVAEHPNVSGAPTLLPGANYFTIRLVHIDI